MCVLDITDHTLTSPSLQQKPRSHSHSVDSDGEAHPASEKAALKEEEEGGDRTGKAKKTTPPAAGGGGGEHGDDVGGGGGTQGVWHSLNTPTYVLRYLLGSCLCTRVSTPSGDHIQHRLLPPAVGPGAGPPTYVYYTVPFSARYGGSSCI